MYSKWDMEDWKVQLDGLGVFFGLVHRGVSYT